MDLPASIVFLMCGALILQSQATCAKSVVTERLLQDLMGSDNVYVRPNADVASVAVTFGLNIDAIYIEDVTKSSVKVHGYLVLSWYNERLSWNPLEHNNISKIRIPSDRIWLPDIRLYNNLDAWSRMYTEDKTLALVDFTGTVQYVPPVTFVLDCDVTKSQDEVRCGAKFASWSYDGFQIDLMAGSSEITGRFNHLVDSNITRESVMYTCCPDPYVSIQVTFTARKTK